MGFPHSPKSRIYETRILYLVAIFKQQKTITDTNMRLRRGLVRPRWWIRPLEAETKAITPYTWPCLTIFIHFTHIHAQPVKWQWDCWNLASFPVPMCKRRSKRERKQMFNRFTSDRERKRPLEWPGTAKLIPHLPYSQTLSPVSALSFVRCLFIDFITMLPVFGLVFLCHRGSRPLPWTVTLIDYTLFLLDTECHCLNGHTWDDSLGETRKSHSAMCICMLLFVFSNRVGHYINYKEELCAVRLYVTQITF